jgi:hypothetical protein
MKRETLVFIGLFAVLALFTITAPAFAGTLQWDRNTEADMDHYNVYACLVPGCTVLQSSAMKLPNAIVQPAAGIVPSTPLPVGEGVVAVSAVDHAGNESGLSVSIPFDAKAPAVPVNPRIQ